jgi:hypothetical protein
MQSVRIKIVAYHIYITYIIRQHSPGSQLRKLELSAPYSIENLLCVPLQYRIFALDPKKPFLTEHLAVGETKPLHLVDLSQVLHMQATPSDYGK